MLEQLQNLDSVLPRYKLAMPDQWLSMAAAFVACI